MSKKYKLGVLARPHGQGAIIGTVPRNTGARFFSPEETVKHLSAVSVLLAGIKVETVSSDLLCLNLTGVDEWVNGQPVLDSWVICAWGKRNEVGIQIEPSGGRIIRIYLANDNTYVVQSIAGNFVREEVNGVRRVELADVVFKLANLDTDRFDTAWFCDKV